MSQKTVLITGCSSGFGYGAALKFARNGYYVFATVRNLQSQGAKDLQKIAKKEKLPLEVIQLDVTKEESIEKAITTICHPREIGDPVNKVRRMHDGIPEQDLRVGGQARDDSTTRGRIDILINNAGYGVLGPIEDFSIDEIKQLYETNIFGVIRMIKAVVPIMRENKSGLIINLSSINGIVPFPLFSIYSTTKFAIETLTEGLRFELKHFGIKVTMVEPGSFLTNFSKNRKEPALNMRRNDSPYKPFIDYFWTRYAKTHRIGDKSITSKTADPQEVVETFFKIAQTENPKMRYRVGGDAHKFYFIRKLLPTVVWEWLLHRTYKW